MKKKDEKSPINFFPLNRYILKDSMKSIVVDYKKNNYKKDRFEEYSKFKTRDFLSKIKFVEQFDDILPKSTNFLENLNYFLEKLTDPELVLFILAKLELNGITSYPRLIKEHLCTLRSKHYTNGSSDDHSYINRLLRNLAYTNNIRRVHDCPNCNMNYGSQIKERFPDYC